MSGPYLGIYLISLEWASLGMYANLVILMLDARPRKWM